MVIKSETIELEIDLLLEAIYRTSGYDFRNYSRESLYRRLEKIKFDWRMDSFLDLIPKAIHDNRFLEDFIHKMSISVTEMFRDPEFYVSVRDKIVPILKTYPFLKIWSAGCATGEEAYTLAILMQEENISSRVQVYATDFNNTSINKAKLGKTSKENIAKYSDNYEQYGGKHSLSKYYSFSENKIAVLKPELLENILFTYHNLATDGSFGEMNMIICRNVMIYFDKILQNRVLRLFEESLCQQGFLCLGIKESLDFSEVRDRFEVVDKDMKIYRKLLN